MSFQMDKFKFNKDSELIEPELHDCEITGLKISGAPGIRTLIVQLVDESGVSRRMTFKGAIVIHCSNFRAQNVVSHVSIKSNDDCSQELQKLEALETTKEMTKYLKARIMSGDLGFVHVVPSVGCEIYCVCEDYEIT